MMSKTPRRTILVLGAFLCASALSFAGGADVLAVETQIAHDHVVEGEPVIMTLVLRNLSSEAVTLDLGRSFEENLALFIVDSAGRVLKKTPPRPEMFGSSGGARMEAQAQWRRDYVLSEWFPPLVPGRYPLRARIMEARPNGTLPHLSQPAEIAFTVEPQNSGRLRARCEDLLSDLAAAEDFDRANIPATALAYVSGPLVIPYLVQAIRYQPSRGTTALMGFSKFKDNEEAASALISLMDRTEDGTAGIIRGYLVSMAERTGIPEIRSRLESALRTHPCVDAEFGCRFQRDSSEPASLPSP